jgi:hypothetical protein
MMRAGGIIVVAVMLMCVGLLPREPSKAQTGEALLESIHASIVQMLKDENTAVDVSVSDKGQVFTVARVNSRMNFAGHSARSEEASQIAIVVFNTLNAKAASNKVRFIRVIYLSRGESSRDRIVDVVEYRCAPTGPVEFHRTSGPEARRRSG